MALNETVGILAFSHCKCLVHLNNSCSAANLDRRAFQLCVAADRGSIPGFGKSASHQTASGTASAGNAHSLARKINPPTAS